MSVIARTSRVSSGSTSRVPLGIGWIMRIPRLCVYGLRGHALDACAEIAQALVDALVATVDLADVANLAAPFGAQRCQQHRHAGADVRRLDALAAQAPGACDDRAVRVAHDDVGAHQDQLVREDQTVLEHPLVYEDRALSLRR